MPDILIRGVELPKYGCAGCYFKTGKYCGIIEKNENVEEYSLRAERHPDCPLIELPPHGDLIDRDEFVKSQCNSCDGSCECVECDCLNCEQSCRCDMIVDAMEAPVVVPAERSEP